MRILYVDYTLKHKSLDIYTSGCKCNPHCKGCQNPETWDFHQGELYDENYFKYLSEYVENFNSLIDNIMIFGGEPLDNDINDVIKMISDLNKFDKKIWLFTRYELNEIPKELQMLCNFIKTGEYIPELTVDNNEYYGIKLSTSNQKIYKLN